LFTRPFASTLPAVRRFWAPRRACSRPHRAAATARTVAALALASTAAVPAHALAPPIETALRESPYVYIATERKDGSFGAAAEIWFMYHDGAVFVASPATTWRARRIRAGRPKARIAVGRRDGPRFEAIGRIVSDPALYEALFERFAAKYPGGWPQYEARFRSGLQDGSRVLIRYDPRLTD